MRDKDDKYIWKNLVESTQDYRTAGIREDLYILEDHGRMPPRNVPDFVEYVGRSGPPHHEWSSRVRVFNGKELVQFFNDRYKESEEYELDTILNPLNSGYIYPFRAKKIFDKGDVVDKRFQRTDQDYYIEVPSTSLMISGQEMERFLDFSSSTKAKNTLRRLR